MGRSGSVGALRLPGFAGRLHLRRGTTDVATFHQVLLKGAYDWDGCGQSAWITAAYNRIIAEGGMPFILDAGANIGLSSLWYHNRFPHALIYAVEPDERNFALLRTNTEAYPNIVPLKGAIWDRHATVRVENDSADANAFQVAECAPGSVGGIAAYSVGEIMQMAGATRILVAKIDIEGSERELFRSNTGWLDVTDGIAIELHDWLLPGKGTSRTFLAELSRRRFEIAWSGETMFCFRVPPALDAAAGGTPTALAGNRVFSYPSS
jgi:FkbM family methyltransferase